MLQKNEGRNGEVFEGILRIHIVGMYTVFCVETETVGIQVWNHNVETWESELMKNKLFRIVVET